MRKLVGIKEVDPFPIYDITVENDHCFELENGIIAHNSMYPKQIVSGGKGAYYSANVIWIIGRQQDKDSTGLKGYRFIINIEKSRFVKEGSKFPITVSFDGGIDKYSGIYDLAVEAGYIVKSGGWCQIKDLKTGELAEQKIRESNITEEWLDELIKSENFKKYIKDMYAL